MKKDGLDEIKDRAKFLICNTLIMIIYLFLLLLLEDVESNINYKIALINIIYYLCFVNKEKKLNEKEKQLFNEIFYFLVIIGIICIVII